MKHLIAAALAAGCLVSSAPVFSAEDDAGSFDKWLSPDAPACVPVSTIKSVATVRELTPEQFVGSPGAAACHGHGFELELRFAASQGDCVVFADRGC